MTLRRLGRLLAVGVLALGVATACASAPAPDSRGVRDRAVAAKQSAEQVTGSVRLGQPLVSAWRDHCRRGEHNWKINTDYEWWCTYTHVEAVAATGTVREVATAQHEALLRAGCRPDTSDHPSRHGLPTMLDNYPRGNEAPDQLPDVRYLCPQDVTMVVNLRTPAAFRGTGDIDGQWTGYLLRPGSQDWAKERRLSEEDRAALASSTAPLLVLLQAKVDYHRK